MIRNGAACLAFAGLLPTAVLAAELPQRTTEFSFWSSFLQMAAALLLVVGLILLTYVVATRIGGKLPSLTPGNRHIRMLEVRHLGPRKALLLVEVGGEYLLLASCGDQLRLVKKIDHLVEEIELLGEPGESPSFLGLLKRSLSRPSRTENMCR